MGTTLLNPSLAQLDINRQLKMIQNKSLVIGLLLAVVAFVAAQKTSSVPKLNTTGNVGSDSGCNKFGVWMGISTDPSKYAYKRIDYVDTPEDCHYQCADLYDDVCRFFRFIPYSSSCYIYAMPLNDFTKIYSEVFGYYSSTPENCQNNECAGFVHEQCTYGDDYQVWNDVKSEEDCQQRCDPDSQCIMYNYLPATLECRSRTSDISGCQGLIGEKYADMNADYPRNF